MSRYGYDPKGMDALIQSARGLIPADLLVQNASVFNPFTLEWEDTSFTVCNGRIAGYGNKPARAEIDLGGAPVVPGFIDAHLHIESSLLTPTEYSRLVIKHGTTTIIADPHEIANVCGIQGVTYMLDARTRTDVDVLIMLPSCVPATSLDESFELLDAARLAPLINHNGIVGLGEMMNVPGVLGQSPDVMEKINLTNICDGHAPMLSGADLDAYVAAGIQSDHETITNAEGLEKLRRGMFLFIREGSTEHNIRELISLVNLRTVGRCSFCTDDRHVDMLVSAGHIDDCIRTAICTGLEPELAYRMASLSPAERFGLNDRGALSPGRIADFSVLDDVNRCIVRQTFRKGVAVLDPGYHPAPPCSYVFRSRVPCPDEIEINGNGIARVIGLIPGQIATESLSLPVRGDDIPDTGRDILKVVSASRYDDSRVGVGLVHGMQLKEGAIACSIAHDGHHLMAVGVDDADIISACKEVIRHRGGMVCVYNEKCQVLPLDCAGLMADAPYEKVFDQFNSLMGLTEKTGAINNPFMYLSFLSLTVIPALRITPSGVFDASSFAPASLFLTRSD
ncbi:MAG TPA: adenine deaminase [Methanospirillum sp.]|nr:adenine deaminase [Methanospirillum sp.]